MSGLCAGNNADGSFLSEDGQGLSESGQGAARCRADRHPTNGLRLAATPNLSVTALLTGLPGNGGRRIPYAWRRTMPRCSAA